MFFQFIATKAYRGIPKLVRRRNGKVYCHVKERQGDPGQGHCGIHFAESAGRRRRTAETKKEKGRQCAQESQECLSFLFLGTTTNCESSQSRCELWRVSKFLMNYTSCSPVCRASVNQVVSLDSHVGPSCWHRLQIP